MYYYLVSPNTVVRKDEMSFTYHSERPVAIGTIVRISIGKKESTGVITGTTTKPSFPTKSVGEILTDRPLPRPLIEFAHWLNSYYATPMPFVLQALLPSGLHKKRRQSKRQQTFATRKRTKIVLNSEQSHAVKIINRHQSGTMLLHGVTGAGKTQVYIEAAKHEARQGRSSIILVPEIALTTQLVAEFSNHFEHIIVTHSGMTEAERHKAWLQALTSDEPIVVIGPRSALFMPIDKLGLIVIDECHEPGFKQEQSPRYSALRAASMLARFHKQAKALFGSATPSVTDYYLAKNTKSPIIKLTTTAIAARTPQVTLVDSTKRDGFREHRFISDNLIREIRQSIENGKQALIFHNRRGTAPIALCQTCGWTALCSHCYVPMTLHADKHLLLCHLCDTKQRIPNACPDCHHPDIVFRGIGTKLVEDELKRLFPKARIARFDADNSTHETLQHRYQSLYDGDIDIIIGTQLVAKGLDLPNLQVVGIIQADSGLQLPDYQAEERVFQLLYQAAGRVGRGAAESSVVIQTYHPQHPAIQLAIARDYQGFYERQLKHRQQATFPPFVHLLKLTCTYKTENGAIKAAQKLAAQIHQSAPEVKITGPTPAFYERLGGNYRWQLIIKSKQRSQLVAIAKNLPANWQADLDPTNLL